MRFSVPLVSACIAALQYSSIASASDSKTCYNYEIPVEVTAPYFKFIYDHWRNNNQLTDFLVGVIARNAPTALAPFLFAAPVNKTSRYTISATFCSPKADYAPKLDTVLLATHGIGFDGTYWNSAFDPAQYNFVDYAVAKGYSVFFYDRLGTGKSTKPSGYDTQPLTQLAILKELTLLVRSGKYTGKLGAPKKIVHVGHSFGSVLSNALIGRNPGISDGAVLTGYGVNQTNMDQASTITGFAARIAKTVNPSKFGKLDTGFIATADIYAFQQLFFKSPFQLRALDYAYSIAAANSVPELLLLPTLATPATKVTIPVQVKNFILQFQKYKKRNERIANIR